MLVDCRIDLAFFHPGGNEDGRDAHPQAREIERWIDSDFTVRAGNVVGRWHPVIETAVLVVQNHQQALFPERTVPQRFIYLRNQIFTQPYIVRRVLIVRLPMGKVNEARLNEGVGSQFSILYVLGKLVKLLEMTQCVTPVLQDDALGNVSVVHIPGQAGFEKGVEDGLHAK